MKKILALSITAAISGVSMAGFVAIINGKNHDENGFNYKLGSGGGQYQASKVKCDPGDGVTRAQLENMISYGQDVSTVCTSDITDFSYLILGSSSSLSSMSSFTGGGDEGEGGEGEGGESGGTLQPRNLFNQDISRWDVSNGTNFEGMFFGLDNFNQDISGWDVSKGTNFKNMFKEASSFDQPLGSWDVSNGTNFEGMFKKARMFNQPLNDWDVSKNQNFSYMFDNADLFNQPLNNWDVSSGTAFREIFREAKAFNQDVNNWDVSKNRNFNYMFYGASAFNQPLNDWDMSNGESITSMFTDATSFNQPLDNWDVSNVSYFSLAFYGATSFNQDIHLWDVSNATQKSSFSYSSGLDADNIPCNFGGNCSLDTDGDGTTDADEIKSGTDPLDEDDYPKTINHPKMGIVTQEVKDSYSYYDDGGPDGFYSKGVGHTMVVFKPKNAGDLIEVHFDQFVVNAHYASLYIYDGTSTSDPLLKICQSSQCLDQTFKATNSSGALTFKFYSWSSKNVRYGWEAQITSVAPPNTDTDGDGTIDAIDTDDDNDGFSDTDELLAGTDPLDSGSIPPDTDGDGTIDAIDTDDDNDGFSDADEASYGTDPLDANSSPKIIKHPLSGTLVHVVDDVYSYFDNGGKDNVYAKGLNSTIVFKPENSGEKVSINFVNFLTSTYFGTVKIYDGPSINSPLLKSCYYQQCLSNIHTASTSGGELTVQFISHETNSVKDGWFALVSSIKP